MSKIKIKMIQDAVDEYGKIYPCGNAEVLSDCFTQIEDRMFFWFNTVDNSTRVLEEEDA